MFGDLDSWRPVRAIARVNVHFVAIGRYSHARCQGHVSLTADIAADIAANTANAAVALVEVLAALDAEALIERLVDTEIALEQPRVILEDVDL